MGAVLLRTLVLVIALAAPAWAQRSEKFPEYGFRFEPPSRFEARPVPPDSPGLALVYAPKDAPTDRAAPVLHEVHRFRFDGAAELAVQRWALDSFRPSKLEKVRSVRERDGRAPTRFEGETTEEDGSKRSLFIHAWCANGGATVFVGRCDAALWRREKRAFDRTAMSFRFFDAAEESEARKKWEKRYRRTRLAHKDERIELASAQVEGWQVRDTEHSLILYHGASTSPVLEQVARNLVAVRARFARDFPPDRPIDALSVVRVCRDRGEYLTYGGKPSTVGYFNPSSQELVLYDAREDRSEAMPDDHQTMRTLYHEACHQFLYHTASALSPHSWYDEGTAEFYAGAVLENGRVTGVVGLEDRDRFLRMPETRRRYTPLEDLLSMSQSEFYADADVNYSLGYAFIRFLRTSDEAAGERAWRDLPKRYFERLRSVWRREAEGLALSGITSSKYGAAIERAREAALDHALEDVDLAELETAFHRWLATDADSAR